MKRGLIVIIICLVLILSLSFVSASWFGDFFGKITGAQIEEENETQACLEIPGSMWCPDETTLCPMKTDEQGCTVWDCDSCEEIPPEPEPETCPASINMNFDKSNYDVGDQFEFEIGVFDSQGNPIPNYPFYIKMYDDRWHTPGQERTGSDGYLRSSGTVEKLPGGATRAIFNFYTEETEFCGIVEDTTEIEIIIKEEYEPESKPEPEPRDEVETCATKIGITTNKEVYYFGDNFEITMEIFDAQANPLADYSFFFQVYDKMWHTPEKRITSVDGDDKMRGTIEKGNQPEGKVKLKVYTQEYSNCNSVEDILEVEIKGGENKEEVCGIGTCVPEEEVKEIPEGEVLYSCNGCELEGKCYPIGYRKTGEYCTPNKEFIIQIEKGECENNFECKSNICVSGECVSEGLMKKIMNWFRQMFRGGEDDEEKPEVDCSKLLIEKNIWDYEHFLSEYGHTKESQVPLYSEVGEQIGVVKCCVSGYYRNKEPGGMALVCPFDNRQDIKNSLRWLSARGELSLGEYKGEEVYDASNVKVWTHKDFALAVGIDPKADIQFPEEIIDAYLKKYKNDLEDFEIPEGDVPYEPKPLVFCTDEDKNKAKECMDNGGMMQSDPYSFEGTQEGKERCKEYGEGCCEVYTGCILSNGSTEYRDGAKEFLTKAEILGEITLIDFETHSNGNVLQNDEILIGNEWESLGVVFETPSEDYLKVFGPWYPFNPLDKLSLSPGFGPYESGTDTHDDLNIIFSEPVKAVGIYLLDLGETDERESITFLDANNNLIKKISPWPKSTFGNPAPGTFVSLIHEQGISKIEILENTQDSDDIAYDNLYFVK